MQNWKRLVMVIALVLGLSGMAQAAVLYTPAMTPEGGGSFICRVVNVSGQTRNVTIDIMSHHGGKVATSFEIPILRGQMESVMRDNDSTRSYCRVTVQGSKQSVRVSMESRIGGDTVAVVQGH